MALADCNTAKMSGGLDAFLGRDRRGRRSSPSLAQFHQALLHLDDPASAGHVACDPLVNEYALAAMPERGEDDARYRLAESVFRRFCQLAAGSAALLRAVLRKGAARSGTGDINVAGRDRGLAERRRK